ncbi:MAG: O-antigen ligase family protein [Pirellulales bacterium]|nr:O-antigen ligase family protein [Pirellulales bacterium]
MPHDQKTHHRVGRTAESRQPACAWDTWLLQVVDLGLAACLLVVPLLMGGRHAVGQLVLIGLAVTVAIAWAVRMSLQTVPTWRYNHAMLVLFGAILLVAFQLIPLPDAIWRSLAGRSAELLPLWSSDAPTGGRLGTWNSVSLTPEATRGGLAVLVAYAILFFVTTQRVNELRDIQRLLRCCAVAAVVMAAFGLIQFFTNNGRFFWFYQAPFATTKGVVKGSFTNRNHFAQFLALGTGPLIWWLCHSYSGLTKRPQDSGRFGSTRFRHNTTGCWLAFGLGIVLLAGLLSLSRGGNAVLFLAATIASVVCCWAAAVRGRLVAGLAAVGLLIGVSLAIFGFDRVTNRLDDFTSGSLEVLDRRAGRRTIWATVIRAIPDFAVVGAGVGSHRDVYPTYLENPPDGAEFTHAENGYLQVPLETGAVGAFLLAAGIGLCMGWCVAGLWRSRDKRLTICLGALAASLAANALHALVDFVWYVPGCMALVAVLAACACRGRQMTDPVDQSGTDVQPVPRIVALSATVLLLIVGAVIVVGRVGPAVAQVYWNRYLVASERDEIASERHEKASPTAGSAIDAEAVAYEQECIRQLQEVIRWQPGHVRAQMALAQSHLHLFDLLQSSAVNPMSLPNIRDAALSSRSHFRDKKEQDQWMRRAIGEHCEHLKQALRHVRLALAMCPMEGKGYVHLAELAFLDDNLTGSKEIYLDQALRVRPFDGYVLYSAANEAWLAGKPEEWLELSKRAFHSGRTFQKQIINDLIGHTSPAGLEFMIDFILQQYKPDLAGLGYIRTACQKQAQPNQLDGFLHYYAQRAEYEAKNLQGKQAAAAWLVARRVYRELADKPRSLECAKQAYRCWPNDFSVRGALAIGLIDAGQFAEAQNHLQWCLRRNPKAKWLETHYRKAVSGQLDQQSSVAGIDAPTR